MEQAQRQDVPQPATDSPGVYRVPEGEPVPACPYDCHICQEKGRQEPGAQGGRYYSTTTCGGCGRQVDGLRDRYACPCGWVSE